MILKQSHRNFSIKVKYRAEIDGLRAIAVVAVILFRAGFDLFTDATSLEIYVLKGFSKR